MTLRVERVSAASTLLAVFSSSFLCFFLFSSVAAAPRQMLMPRPGYIPVYIRLGDMPLEDIDPKLAAAFNELEVGNLVLENVANKSIVTSDGGQNNSDDVIVEAAKQPDRHRSGAKIEESHRKKQPLVVGGAIEAEEKQRNNSNNNNNNNNNNSEVAHLSAVDSITEKESDVASFDVVKAAPEAEASK